MKLFKYFSFVFLLYFLFSFSPVLAAKKTVVLPFEVMSVRTDLKETGDAVAFNLSDSLSVISLNNNSQENQVAEVMKSLNLKASDFSDIKNIVRTGKYFEADTVISGTIEVVDGKYKVTTKLTEVNTGKNLKTFSLQSKALPETFEKIALDTISTLNIKLTEEQKKNIVSINKAPKNLSVLENYVKGRNAFYLFSFSELDKSVSYFNKAISEDNTFLPAQAYKAKAEAVKAFLLSRNNEFYKNYAESAGKIAVRLIQNPSYSMDGYKAIALIKLAEGNFLQAHNSIKIVLTRNTDDAEANLISWLINREDPSGEMIKKSLAINPFSVLSNLLAGKAFENKGKYDEALESYNKALSLSPKNGIVLTYTGDLFLKQGKADKAIEEYERAGSLWLSQSRLANLYLQQNDYLKAEEYLKKALKLNADSPENNFQFALLHYNRGLFEDAERYFKRAISVNPTHARAHYHLGLIYQGEGKYEEAMKSYDSALVISPDMHDVYYNKGIIFRHQGKTEEAISEYKKAFTIKPDFAEAYYNLAILYKQLGKTEEAIAGYREALRIKPDFAEAYINLGSIFFERNMLDEAEKNYKEAIKIRNDYARAHNNLGAVYQKQGKINEAINEFKEAIKISPEYGNAYANLGAVYQQQGKKKEATAEMKRACDLGYLPACK